MTIKSRLKKLESSVVAEVERKPLFVSIVPAKDGRQSRPSVLHHAVIAGTSFRKIMRDKAETEQAFARRVFAVAAANKRVEDMTDDELEVALAAADEKLALEKAANGDISDEGLRNLVGGNIDF